MQWYSCDVTVVCKMMWLKCSYNSSALLGIFTDICKHIHRSIIYTHISYQLIWLSTHNICVNHDWNIHLLTPQPPPHTHKSWLDIAGIVQERRNSVANALELHLSCTNPAISYWHLYIPEGLSVVQCSLGHIIGLCFMTQFQWHEAIVLDNWQLAELPQSGGPEFDPRQVHDNLSVPLWVYMRFPVPEHQN